jgi:hypothetical protein
MTVCREESQLRSSSTTNEEVSTQQLPLATIRNQRQQT